MDVPASEAAAKAALAPLGIALTPVVESPPPILVGDEYLGWIPSDHRKGHSGAQLIAHATTVRRHPNPEFSWRASSDARAAAATGLDRVEALVHLAERQNALTLAFLQRGAWILGMTLRTPDLLKVLLATDQTPWWNTALAALALLGDGEAVRVAHGIVADPTAPADRVTHSIFALAVTRCTGVTWPGTLLDREAPMIHRALRAAVRAPRTDAWLLPG